MTNVETLSTFKNAATTDAIRARSTSGRKVEIRALLHEAQSVLAKCRKVALNDTLHSASLGQIIRDLDRALRQFDSKLFFVVVFGPLKAGKSTLTNTLAGECVSPSGFGKETTRRPSLVIRAAESGIDQYISTNPEVNSYLCQRRAGICRNDGGDTFHLKVREAFDEVADHIRGIRTLEEFEGRIRIDTRSLNAASIEQALTQDAATEPLFTVVRCQGGALITEGVAVVDMPGLDGNRSNWRDDPIHEWVINRAEFFLFVQSSVAALNSATHDFLKEIVDHTTKPPIWLVQNIFDARHWQPLEERKKEEANQREEGKKRISELLNCAPRAVFGLNVAKAWDGRMQKNPDWLKESDFDAFENDLAEVLHSERAQIQERNCLASLQQQLGRATARLAEVTAEADAVRKEFKNVLNRLAATESGIDSVNFRGRWERAVRAELATMAEKPKEDWTSALTTAAQKLRNKLNSKTPGKIINQELAAVSAAVASEGARTHFLRSAMLPGYHGVVQQFCCAAENEAVSKCNQTLASLQKPPFSSPLNPSVDDLPTIETKAFEQKELAETNYHIPIWTKNYDPAAIGAHIANIERLWREEIASRTELWVKELGDAHFNRYCEARRKEVKQHLSQVRSDFEGERLQAVKSAEASLAAANQMQSLLATLGVPLNNALSAMDILPRAAAA